MGNGALSEAPACLRIRDTRKFTGWRRRAASRPLTWLVELADHVGGEPELAGFFDETLGEEPKALHQIRGRENAGELPERMRFAWQSSAGRARADPVRPAHRGR